MNELSVIIVVVGGHRFIFSFDETNRTNMLIAIRKMALDPALPEFNWFIAGEVANRIRKGVLN